ARLKTSTAWPSSVQVVPVVELTVGRRVRFVVRSAAPEVNFASATLSVRVEVLSEAAAPHIMIDCVDAVRRMISTTTYQCWATALAVVTSAPSTVPPTGGLAIVPPRLTRIVPASAAAVFVPQNRARIPIRFAESVFAGRVKALAESGAVSVPAVPT